MEKALRALGVCCRLGLSVGAAVRLAGMAVEVGYGVFMEREFIHTARQVKDGIKPPVATAPVNAPRIAPQQATAQKEHLAQAVKTLNGDERKRSIALAYSKDLVVAGKIELAGIYSQADDFIKYMLAK